MKNDSTPFSSDSNVLTSSKFSKTPIHNHADIRATTTAPNVVRLPYASVSVTPDLTPQIPAFLVDHLCQLFEAYALGKLAAPD